MKPTTCIQDIGLKSETDYVGMLMKISGMLYMYEFNVISEQPCACYMYLPIMATAFLLGLKEQKRFILVYLRSFGEQGLPTYVNRSGNLTSDRIHRHECKKTAQYCSFYVERQANFAGTIC